MKSLTIRLPDALAADIEAECRRRRLAKSDVVRERLARAAGTGKGRPSTLDSIADLVGSVDLLPADLSTKKKRYLRSTGYGAKRPR